MNRPKIIFKADQWIDHSCYSYPQLTLLGNKVQACNQVDIFGKQRIKNKYRFTVTGTRIVYSLGVGVVDQSYKSKKIIKDFSHVICYCNDGLGWDGQQGKFRGNGFKIGESVTVQIDLSLGKIQWRIGQEKLFSIYSEKLKNSQVTWVPYLWLCKGSSAIITN